MAIKYKIIERGEPGVPGGGTKKFYATVISSGEKNIEDLTKSIEMISTVNGADIRAVLYALVEIMANDLSNGFIVRIGDLGNMRVSISSEGESEESDVKASSIRSNRVLFSPGKKLREMQKLITYQKES